MRVARTGRGHCSPFGGALGVCARQRHDRRRHLSTLFESAQGDSNFVLRRVPLGAVGGMQGALLQKELEHLKWSHSQFTAATLDMFSSSLSQATEIACNKGDWADGGSTQWQYIVSGSALVGGSQLAQDRTAATACNLQHNRIVAYHAHRTIGDELWCSVWALAFDVTAVSPERCG